MWTEKTLNDVDHTDVEQVTDCQLVCTCIIEPHACNQHIMTLTYNNIRQFQDQINR